MRPSGITDGIPSIAEWISVQRPGASFNEAVGYYRRNPGESRLNRVERSYGGASMRPSGITDGICRP